AAADLLQRQLAAFIVQLLEPVEAVPAIPHHLAGLTDVAELLGQFQQPYLHADDLLLLGHVVVSVHAGRRAAVPALGENRVPPPRLLSGKTNNECQVKSKLIQLKWLWARLKQLSMMALSREELLMKLGAARAHAPAAWRLVVIAVAPEGVTFTYHLDRNRLRRARRREGRYLLRTNLTEDDPA